MVTLTAESPRPEFLIDLGFALDQSLPRPNVLGMSRLEPISD
jgi:hypothetical protein